MKFFKSLLLGVLATSALLLVGSNSVTAQSYNDDTYDYEYSLDSSEEMSDEEALFMMVFFGVFGCIGLLLYIYGSYSLMTIANKLNVDNGWLAFIPIANLYILVMCAGLEITWFIGILVLSLLSAIPCFGFIFGLFNVGISVYCWTKIAERRGFESWLGFLLLVPIANIILPGYIAFAEPAKKSETPSPVSTPVSTN